MDFHLEYHLIVSSSGMID